LTIKHRIDITKYIIVCLSCFLLAYEVIFSAKYLYAQELGSGGQSELPNESDTTVALDKEIKASPDSRVQPVVLNKRFNNENFDQPKQRETIVDKILRLLGVQYKPNGILFGIKIWTIILTVTSVIGTFIVRLLVGVWRRIMHVGNDLQRCYRSLRMPSKQSTLIFALGFLMFWLELLMAIDPAKDLVKGVFVSQNQDGEVLKAIDVLFNRCVIILIGNVLMSLDQYLGGNRKKKPSKCATSKKKARNGGTTKK